jgi:antirestriction protein ArdC
VRHDPKHSPQPSAITGFIRLAHKRPTLRGAALTTSYGFGNQQRPSNGSVQPFGVKDLRRRIGYAHQPSRWDETTVAPIPERPGPSLPMAALALWLCACSAVVPASPARSTQSKGGSATKISSEEKLVCSLITLLEAGTTPWRREWDGVAGGHHVNLFSGRRYRGANPVLLTLGLHLRGSALPYWCGFAEAKAHGLAPRKGSKAVHVLRPQVHQLGESQLMEQGSTAVSAQGGDGQPAAEARRSWVSYRPIALFNAADLEGGALEGLIQKRQLVACAVVRPELERLAAAEAVLSRWPVPASFAGDQACYLPVPDRIQLPDRSAFHSAGALYATWAHEAIHSTGHRSRLARDLSGGMGADGDGGRPYAREELVAELGAVLLGDRLEIGSATANHAAYLGHWVELLKESPRVLLQVLSDVRRAADLICPESSSQ